MDFALDSAPDRDKMAVMYSCVRTQLYPLPRDKGVGSSVRFALNSIPDRDNVVIPGKYYCVCT